MTPKRPGDNRGAGHFVYRGGDLVEGKGASAFAILPTDHTYVKRSGICSMRYFEAAAIAPLAGEAPDRVATGILDINDARKLHHQLLKRQYFGERLSDSI